MEMGKGTNAGLKRNNLKGIRRKGFWIDKIFGPPITVILVILMLPVFIGMGIYELIYRIYDWWVLYSPNPSGSGMWASCMTKGNYRKSKSENRPIDKHDECLETRGP